MYHPGFVLVELQSGQTTDDKSQYLKGQPMGQRDLRVLALPTGWNNIACCRGSIASHGAPLGTQLLNFASRPTVTCWVFTFASSLVNSLPLTLPFIITTLTSSKQGCQLEAQPICPNSRGPSVIGEKIIFPP
ncbi:hypothetical protein SKAU_G00216550 [Synaphobranchus kaupii]|uniref:Uncharacterized protein n=1 Tax=Synaphobranchus kaupii TaxID=118154 RepID=A0A9Q1FAD6_SYNKA|nr:hypothetical protein SKAU_G00216550 [Synaphobranchus kaupii]